MTKKQNTNSAAQPKPGKDVKEAQTNISATSEKDAVADSSLDDVSGGSPYVLAGGQSSYWKNH